MAFKLERWAEEHRDGFAELHADPLVMADLGGPIDRTASDEKFDRYRHAWGVDGTSRWAVVDQSGYLLGYAGVMKRHDASHPLGVHHEIGWRFRQQAWGRGLATASARLALAHAWSSLGVERILSYTSTDNQRSQAVMGRLNLTRDSSLDFCARYPHGNWTGLVWVAERPPGTTVDAETGSA